MHVSLPIDTQNPKQNFIPSNVCNQVHVQVQIEERWLELPDGRMRYLKAGSGPPIILIHGLMGYAFSWRFTIPALAPHATIYAVDNLGAGLSPAREGIDCTVHATAKRVLQFADALGIRNFDLLGTSHGGGVAIMVASICADRCAERNDRRLQRLILVAPVNPWSPHGKRFAPFVGSDFGAMLFLKTIESWRSLDRLWLRRLFGDVARIPSDSLEGYRIPALKNHALRHAVHIAKNWTADLAELERAIPKISEYPTLLIWGTKDRAVAFDSAEPLRRNFSNARLVAFDGVGHLPYEEAPEDFNRALADFLIAGPSSTSPIPTSQ
ncbi:MAG: alpha/beta fold hydrolase [Terriglobales bacterium]